MIFDVKTAPMNTTWSDLCAVWQAADEIDLFRAAWNFDHFEPIFSARSGPCLEGWTMLAAMAGLTSRIRLGCQVTGMPYRHPSVLANMAATIDIASGGRFILGVGAGWNKDESDALGIRLPPLKERFDQFDEGLEVMTRLLSSGPGQQVSFEGTHFNLRDAWFEPKPVQAHIPIAIGGTGEKRTLRAVAKYADHWNAITADVASWQRKRDVLYAHCETIGRNPADIECSVNLRFDAATGIGALVESAQQWSAAGVHVGIIYFTTPHTPEPLAAIAEALTGL